MHTSTTADGGDWTLMAPKRHRQFCRHKNENVAAKYLRRKVATHRVFMRPLRLALMPVGLRVRPDPSEKGPAPSSAWARTSS